MKIKFLFICVIFYSGISFPQNKQDTIKQITFLNTDIRHPKFFENNEYGPIESSLLFEIYSDSSVNIGLLNYDAENDTFTDFTKISDNNFSNINPMGLFLYGSQIIFYQTNRNGDWDLVYREYNKTWGNEVVLSDSTGNEINPGYIDSYNYPDSVRILFEKDSSIILLTKKSDSIKFDTIFEKNSSGSYSRPTGHYDVEYYNGYWIPVIDCFAIKKDTTGRTKLVYLAWNFDGKKGDEKVLADSGKVSNPKFQVANFPTLSFESNVDGVNNIYFLDDYTGNGTQEKLLDNPPGNLYCFNSSRQPLIITKNSISKNLNRAIYNPYTYKAIIHDSTFIRVTKNEGDYWLRHDTLINTSIKNAKPEVDIAGFYNNNEIYYYIWEDSLDGRISLFGKKETYHIGDVISELPNTFSLFQNFPNPFNPSTKIEFVIPKTSFVTLKIFDILGREIVTLVNEEKFPGQYIIKFSAENLASGIYIYQLKAGNFVQSKKMVILR